MLKTACLVAALALACVLVRAARVGMAGDYVDPVGKIAAEDEARYANGAIRMAQSGGWLTPRFMGRLALDEPPLLYWLSGAGARIAGVSRLALRAPIALVCALALALVFLWAAELNGPLAGVCAALLLLGDHLWHVLGGMCMADGLLAAFVAGALYALFSDPSLESAGALWGFAGATTAGILTKGLAGAMPLGILGVYWLAARRSWRPSARRAVLAGSLALALAAPWFVYQWLAHGKWFWAEHASRIPGYGAGESLLLFYLSRISLADPILVAISLAALPALTQALRRREPAATLLAAWLAVGALAALVWQSRNVAYLLPTIPAMAILASSFGPFAKDQALRPGLVLALGALAAKALLPSAPWGISFAGGTIEPLAPVVANYCERSRGNELILVGLGDALYGAIEPLPRLRYADIGPLPHGGDRGQRGPVRHATGLAAPLSRAAAGMGPRFFRTGGNLDSSPRLQPVGGRRPSPPGQRFSGAGLAALRPGAGRKRKSRPGRSRRRPLSAVVAPGTSAYGAAGLVVPHVGGHRHQNEKSKD
jgi:hypothetical protein